MDRIINLFPFDYLLLKKKVLGYLKMKQIYIQRKLDIHSKLYRV